MQTKQYEFSPYKRLLESKFGHSLKKNHNIFLNKSTTFMLASVSFSFKATGNTRRLKIFWTRYCAFMHKKQGVLSNNPR